MIRIAMLLALVVGCGDKKADETPSAASGSAPAAGSGSAPAKPAGSAAGSGSGSATAAAGSGSAAGSAAPKEVDLPTAEDFEQDATTRITEKNLEAEVKALEKEIGEN